MRKKLEPRRLGLLRMTATMNGTIRVIGSHSAANVKVTLQRRPHLRVGEHVLVVLEPDERERRVDARLMLVNEKHERGKRRQEREERRSRSATAR